MDLPDTRPSRQRRRIFTPRRFVLVATLSLVAAGIGIGIWGYATWSKARAIGDQLLQLEAVSAGSLADPESIELKPIRAQLDAAREDIYSLQRELGPLRLAGSLFGWFPSIGDDLRNAPGLIDRTAFAVDAAMEAIDGAIELNQTYGVAIGTFESALAAYSAGGLSATIARVRDRFEAADGLLARGRAIAAESGIPGGRLRGKAQRLASAERSLQSFVDWAIPAATAAELLGPVLTSAEPLLSIFEDSDFGTYAHVGVIAEMLSDLEKATGDASRAAATAIAAAPPEVARSSLGKDLRALGALLEGLKAASQGGRIGVNAMQPGIEALTNGTGGLLSDGDSLLRAMEQLAAERQALADASLKLEAAARLLGSPALEARSARWGGLVDRVRELTVRIQSSVDIALAFPAVAREFLGGNGLRTYLVLGQTADELRATGGFVSGVWLMTFFGGALVDVEYQDIVEVDDLDRLNLYPPPPRLLERHMNAPVWLMRDVSWEPDFPSTAAFALELYRLGQKRSVDGVIAVTPWAFLKAAKALGGIPTPEGSIGAEELLPALEAGTDRFGRSYMDTLFQDLLEAIDTALPQSRLFELGAALDDSLAEKQLMIYLTNKDAQRLIEGFGWSGALAMPSHDRVVPIDSNVGWSKVDRNIERSVSYRIVLDPDGPARARLKLSYHNLSSGSDAGCDSQFADRNQTYEVLKNACYWNLVRAYVSEGASLLRGDPLPLPVNSILDQVGAADPGEPTLEVLRGPAGTVFAGLLLVPPGETRSASFVYDVPGTVVDWGKDVATYSLTMQPQAGTVGRHVKIEVVLPEGFDYVSSSIAPVSTAGNTIEFEFLLIRDTEITVEMSRAGAA